jgi:DDE family transposase
MPNEITSILASFDCIPKRLFDVASNYVYSLTLQMKRHTFRMAADIAGLDESRFSAFLNSAIAPEISRHTLNRATRRRLAKAKPIDGRYVFIIDSTIIGRRGRQVENAQKYHHGSGFTNGHKFVNFVLLTPSGVIPIESLPVYTKKYCRQNGIARRSEIEMVEDWLSLIKESTALPADWLKGALFLLDAGFDAKVIQRGIKALGADFLMALKCSRTVNGKQVKEFFRTHRRWLPWKTIRLHVGSGTKKKKRRVFSIRTATKSNLKGVGSVTVVCSKTKSRAKKSTKFLVTSDSKLTGRQIVVWYARRWAIETWHRDMKQNYGFIDCKCARFSAVEAHVNLSLTAFLLAKEKYTKQKTVADVVKLRELKTTAIELTKFGGAMRCKSLVHAAIQAMTA